MPDPNLLFVGCTGRCGSTVFSKVMGLHPEIHAVSRETCPYPPYIEEWKRDILAAEMVKAKEKGAKWILEKSPHNALYAERFVTRYFPGSRYIYLERDRERTVDSLMARGRYVYPGAARIMLPEAARRYWSWFEELSADTLEVIGDLGELFFFDHWLQDPTPSLNGLCEWLDIGPPTLAMTCFDLDRSKGEPRV